tara:strand:- start:15721 stop:16023 length:303 start_codon:yes stop_codon:yes gene_type:complete
VTSPASAADADVARGRANDPPPRAREPAVSLFNHRLRAFSPSRSSRVARRARARSRANGLAETEGRILARARAPAREDDADVAIERASTPIERAFGRGNF